MQSRKSANEENTSGLARTVVDHACVTPAPLASDASVQSPMDARANAPCWTTSPFSSMAAPHDNSAVDAGEASGLVDLGLDYVEPVGAQVALHLKKKLWEIWVRPWILRKTR